MTFESLPDITGDGAAHALASDSSQGKWLQLFCPASNSANVRVGGPLTSSSRGLPIVPGGTMFLPPVTELYEFVEVSKIYYYAANGDALYVLVGG